MPSTVCAWTSASTTRTTRFSEPFGGPSKARGTRRVERRGQASYPVRRMGQVDGLVDEAGQRRDQLVDTHETGSRREEESAVSSSRLESQRSSGITQSGLSPRATRCTLSKALRKALVQFSHVGPA